MQGGIAYGTSQNMNIWWVLSYIRYENSYHSLSWDRVIKVRLHALPYVALQTHRKAAIYDIADTSQTFAVNKNHSRMQF